MLSKKTLLERLKKNQTDVLVDWSDFGFRISISSKDYSSTITAIGDDVFEVTIKVKASGKELGKEYYSIDAIAQFQGGLFE